MNALRQWLAGLAALSAAAAVSYVWLDRPLALLAHNQLAHEQQAALEKLTHIPDPLVPAAAIAFVVLGLMALAGRPLSKLQSTLFIAATGLIMAVAIKDQLKFVFGRTWPETWVQDNPSFIRDGAFGFNWFHGGAGYQSFPSGHMSATCAVVAVFWIAYPRLRALYALMALAVAVGLVGADYHFLSDILAGSYVGVSTGWMATVLCEQRADLRLPGPRS